MLNNCNNTISQSQTDMVHCRPNHFSEESNFVCTRKNVFLTNYKEIIHFLVQKDQLRSCTYQTELIYNRFINISYWNHIKWMKIYISNYQLVWRYRNKQKFGHFRCDLKFVLNYLGISFCQKYEYQRGAAATQRWSA